MYEVLEKNMSDNNLGFYNIQDDLEGYPDAVIYLIIGGRGTGKTYSTLRTLYGVYKEKFAFVKRTNKDVKMLCPQMLSQTARPGRQADFDLSPFKPLNKDFNWNVKPYRVFDGFGGFWNCDDEDKPHGDPVAYITSLHAVANIKGFDMSDCKDIVLDEFIPSMYERVDRMEGLQLLDFYRTVGRANFIKNGEVLRLILLANAMNIGAPIIRELELVDTISKMQEEDIDHLYMKERRIFIRRVPDIDGFREREARQPIYQAMSGTKWADMSLNNNFAYNDFSNVKKATLKNKRCILSLHYKKKDYYLYGGEDGYYFTESKGRPEKINVYNLDRENDQRRFYNDWWRSLMFECIAGNISFQTYDMYDLLVNYRQIYRFTL